MCTTCGCGGVSRLASHHTQHAHHHHDHGDPPHHLQHRHAGSPARIVCDQEGGKRIVQLAHDILGKNKRFAEKNRQYLRRLGVPAFNLVSSPGAGKTTLLARSIREANNSAAIAVIEGDQHTSHDAAMRRCSRRSGDPNQYRQRVSFRCPDGWSRPGKTDVDVSKSPVYRECREFGLSGGLRSGGNPESRDPVGG